MPAKLTQLLWDVDQTTFDYKQYPDFIGYRIAEYGDFSLVHWFCEQFSFNTFYDIVINHKEVKLPTKAFWQEYKKLNGAPTFRSTHTARA